MKKLLPVVIALFGLAAGVGAGLALKPAPEPEPETAAADCPPPAEGEEHAESCPPPGEADPFAPAKPEEKKPAAELAYVTMDKPFVVPVFAGEKVTAMVVMSLSVETDTDGAHTVEAVKPRLRDGFLKAMF